MRDFFDALWGTDSGSFGELRFIHDGKVKQSFYRHPAKLDDLLEEAAIEDREGTDVYFGVLPRKDRVGRSEAIADEASVVWADFDGKSFGSQVGAFHAMAGVTPRPQIVIDSGNGYHAYWLLDDSYPFADIQLVMKGIALEAGSDTNAVDKARILRVPGTRNHKEPKNPKPVRLLRFNLMGRRHRLSDFVDYAERASFSMRRRSSARALPTEGWEPSSDDAPKFPEGQRNNGLARIAGIMVARGLDDDELLIQLMHENEVRCDPPLPENEVLSIVKSVGRYRE